MFVAAAVFAFAACEKTPDNGGQLCADCGQNPCVCTTGSSTELHLDVNVQLQHEVNTNYGGTTATIDGAKVLAFFEFENVQEYFEAMGYLSGGGQVENTLMYGVCVKDGEDWVYTFNPSTSANIGHWFTREGVMTNWGSEEAPQYFFTESQQWMWVGDWRVDDPAAEDDTWSYDLSWNYTVGMEPGYYDLNIGDKLSAVEFIFEESTGKTLYIHWNIEIVDYVDPELGKYPTSATAGTFDIDVPLTFSLAAQGYEYEGATFEEEFEVVKEKLGKTTYEFSKAISAGDVTLTYTLPDGTTGNGSNVWVNADNAITAWGAEDAAVCLEWFYGSTPDALYGHTCAMPSYYEEAPAEGPAYYYSDAVKAAIGKEIKATFTITYGDTVINLNCATTLAE